MAISHFEVESSSLKWKQEINHAETLWPMHPLSNSNSTSHFEVGSSPSKWKWETNHAKTLWPMHPLASPISRSHFEVGSSSLKWKQEINHVETLPPKCSLSSPISSPHFKVGSITSLKWSQEIDYADKHKPENGTPESPSVKCHLLIHSLSEVLSPCPQITSYTSELKQKLEDDYANNSPLKCPAFGSCSVS